MSIVRIVGRIAAVYVVMGLLTLAHWELVWMKDGPFTPPFTRTATTIVLGPGIFLTWPGYWVTMVRLGPWAWIPNYRS